MQRATVKKSLLAAAVAVLAALWVTLAVELSLTRAPWSNEAWAAIPALNLCTHGAMYTSVLEFRNTWLKGLDHHTYWMMPLHLVTQAAWYKLLGFSLFKQRLLSVLFAGMLLAAWTRIVFLVSGDTTASLIFCILLAFENSVLNGAANGRMDMMCAALGSCGIALWLEFQTVSPAWAMIASHSLAAAAILTHPCGVLYAAVLFLMVISMSNWRGLGLCLLPYAIGGALWAIYISQAPGDFKSQFLGNVSGFAGEYLPRTREGGLTSPLLAIVSELRLRYVASYGWESSQVIWLALVGSAALATMLIPNLRARIGIRILFISSVLVFLMMAIFEGLKFPHYIIHPLPFMAALAAAAIGSLWGTHRKLRPALATGLLILVLPQLRLDRGNILLNPRGRTLVPVTDYLRTHKRDGQWIIGPAELGYELGFDSQLRDDVRLGYYSGLRPQFMVLPAWYRLWFEGAGTRDPALHAYLLSTLDRDYGLVFSRGEYRVYQIRNKIE